MKKYGVDGKRRFTIKYPDGALKQMGTCNPDESERFNIILWDGLPFLCQYPKDDFDYSQKPTERTYLNKGTLVANGYYEKEWDEFVSPEEWVLQA